MELIINYRIERVNDHRWWQIVPEHCPLTRINGRRCGILLVVSAYFAVGPVFAILRQVRDDAGGGILELSKPCIDRIFFPIPKSNPRFIKFDKRGF